MNMFWEITELVEQVLGPEKEDEKYNRDYVKDILCDYVTFDKDEGYLNIALANMAHEIGGLKVAELIDQTKDLKERLKRPSRLEATDVITEADVFFTGGVQSVGGYSLFLTPYHKMYDRVKNDPRKLIGRIFIERVNNSKGVQYLKVTGAKHKWVRPSSIKQRLLNLEYRAVTFVRISVPIIATEEIQNYREKYGEL